MQWIDVQATMDEVTAPTIVNAGYLSTNYWVISVGRSRLLVDLGYPGTMGKMRQRLKQLDIPMNEIRFALATHYHIDHAGLAQELKLAGVPLLVLESQAGAIPGMKRFTKPQDHYVEITLDGNVDLAFAESRNALARIGIRGEILATPGHSDDSVSLLLDNGAAFTGDLPPYEYAYGERYDLITSSWRLLQEHGADMIYPAHGPIRPMAKLED